MECSFKIKLVHIYKMRGTVLTTGNLNPFITLQTFTRSQVKKEDDDDSTVS